MGMMISELYDAMKSAGTDEEKTRSVASTVVRYEDRLIKLELICYS